MEAKMKTIEADLAVLGAGPAGTTAAFYAADKGSRVILVEADPRLGGVCLNRGCIPSKALLQAVKPIKEAHLSEARGVSYETPKVDLEKLGAWKESILSRLAQGVSELAKRRGVEVLKGRGRFENSETLRVETQDGPAFIKFKKAIIATGSKPFLPPGFNLGDKRIMTSTEALELEDIPEDLLIVGAGYIGMELGTVYAALGSKIVLAEALSSILPGVDPDLARGAMRYAEKNFREVRVRAKVLKLMPSGKKINVTTEMNGETKEESYDKVLVSIGRGPNTAQLGLENTKVTKDEKGFIRVDARRQTEDPRIYAIGDVAGGALLAHKAAKEARVAVETIHGEASAFEGVTIPAVVFTDPEIAWCGLTETEAKQKGIQVQVARFPWGASGRAVTLDRPDGLTKLLIEPETERILGMGIAGVGAGELISEGLLAIDKKLTARDLANLVHPHPTLSETLMECAESFYGYSTHIFSRRRPFGESKEPPT